MEQKYRLAMAEILEYLNYIDEEHRQKISRKFMNYLSENADYSQKKERDYTKPINEIEFSREAIILIVFISYRFWFDAEDKSEIMKLLKKNELIREQELNEKYNYENLFKNPEKIEEKPSEVTQSEGVSIITEEETKKSQSIFKRIASFFKSLFKKV